MKSYTAVIKNKLLLHATTWMTFTDTVLASTHSVFHFNEVHGQTKWIYGDKDENNATFEWVVGSEGYK